MEFSNSWFADRTQPIWERRVLSHFQFRQGLRYLEIGVCEGQSMAWVLQHLEPKSAVGIDAWVAPREEQEEAFVQYKRRAIENLNPWISDGTLLMLEGRSQEQLAALNKQRPTFDLIYVDGDHHAPEAMLDMQLAFQMLRRKSGWMIVDDLHRQWHHGRPEVFFAVRAFELLYKGRAKRVWEDGRQIAFQRLKG